MSCWCWFIYLFLTPTEEAEDKRTVTALPLIQPLRPQGKTFHLFIYSLGLEVNSQVMPLVFWILGMYFPNTMVTPPGVKSSERSVSLASPQRAFTWHKKQPLQVTILALWLGRVDRLLKMAPSCQQCSGWGQLSHTDYGAWLGRIESRRYISSTICMGLYIPYIFLCGVQGLIDYGVNIWQQTEFSRST